jgi:hypothetical protein
MAWIVRYSRYERHDQRRACVERVLLKKGAILRRSRLSTKKMLITVVSHFDLPSTISRTKTIEERR